MFSTPLAQTRKTIIKKTAQHLLHVLCSLRAVVYTVYQLVMQDGKHAFYLPASLSLSFLL